jgi:hypothetical protein
MDTLDTREVEWIPAQWIELACWNRPMVCFSRTIRIPRHDRRVADRRAPQERAPSIVETMLADLIAR